MEKTVNERLFEQLMRAPHAIRKAVVGSSFGEEMPGGHHGHGHGHGPGGCHRHGEGHGPEGCHHHGEGHECGYHHSDETAAVITESKTLERSRK